MPAPRKQQPKKQTRAIEQDKPGDIDFNLDTFEREGVQAKPFTVVFQGKRAVFADAVELDWRDLLSLMTDPTQFFELALPDPKHRVLFETNKLPMFKLEGLIKKYAEHYGIDPGNAVAS